MAAKQGTKGAAKAPVKKAEQAAAPAAPAAAEQLAPQPAATTDNAAPIPVPPAASTEQPVSEAPGLEAGSSGQDAHLNTDQTAANAAATTSSPAPAAPEAPVGDAAAPATEQPGAVLPYPADVSPGADPLAQALAELNDDGEVEGLWITAVPEQGFRRCGFRFTSEGFGIGLSALTEQQIEQLENEPNLKVERGVFSGLVE